ncbi:MAG: hypothetical protein Q9O62_06550 [Ardenticatenia bacterium]|nr:hypothetical protein [Ardenticatenia bacterium]
MFTPTPSPTPPLPTPGLLLPELITTPAAATANQAWPYVLHIQDTPDDFQADNRYTGPVTLQALAASRPDVPDLARRLEQWGFVEGYRTVYTSVRLEDPVGILTVQSWALLFQDRQGSSRFFNFLDDEYRRDPRTVQEVEVPPLGDEARGYHLVRPMGGEEWTVFLVLIRQGPVVVRLDTTSRSATMLEPTLDYARLLADRLPES